MTARSDSPRRRRGLILTLWLWFLVVAPLGILAVDLGLILGGVSPRPPGIVLLTSDATLVLLSLAAVAALRFSKLGVLGIYLVFGSNVVRMLLFERQHLAPKLGATLLLAGLFGLLVRRVWTEFG